ncbi:MAG: PorP/SprF family type IX secretion system membrane protein [Chitinophagales bacterium]|nr:PorP/SprF family type IX secretion system membrane protein [Chitinophagales bacterium]
MKRFLPLLLVFLFAKLNAQQLPDFSLFRENTFIYNPAVAGTDQASVINLSVRKQWTNINQSPFTAVATFHTSIENKNIGVGATIFNDFIGPTSFSGIGGSFAYNLVFSEYRRGISEYKVLSFGLAASLVQYRINGSKIRLDQPTDQAIFNNRGSQFFPDASFGIFYKSKTLFASVAVPQLLQLNVPIAGQNDEKTKFKKMQHYYAMFGGKIFFKKNSGPNDTPMYLEPAFNFHYVIGSMPQAILSARFAMQDVFFAGIGYRSLSTMIFEGGFTIKKAVSIFYSYDMGAGNVRQDVGQVHELGMKFKFKKDFFSY